MIPKVYRVSPRLCVRACQTEKLKAGMISLSVVLPIDRASTYMTSLLLSVLHRGTKRYPSVAALNRRLDYLFGTEMSVRNYYRGDCHVVGLAADLLGSEYLPQGQGERLMEDVLEVMRDILFDPLLDEHGLLRSHYVESEKNLQCDAIRALKNSPRAYAIEHCFETLYQNEPCGVPIYGTEEMISRVTAEDLTAHWRRLIDQIKIECFYVGSDEPLAVSDRVADVLLPMLRDDAKGRAVPPTEIVRSAEAVRQVSEELAVAQGQLVIGVRTGVSITDPDYYACAVANDMLGASPISKLFVNVREKHGLCYHCSSSYNSYKGVILITCGLQPQKRALAEREILAQLESLAKGEFDPAELDASKKSYENVYRQLEDSPTALESYYLGRALMRIEESLDDCRRKFASVTREDVLRVAKRFSVDTVYFLNGTLPSDGEEAYDEES